MNYTKTLSSMLIGLTLMLGACGQKATYIETGGTESIVSVGEVDIQDIKTASSGMLESLLEDGILDRAPHKPARLVLDRIVNDTSSYFDMGELLYPMREQLVRSGQAEVVTTWGDNPESKEAQEIARREAFLSGKTEQESAQPDFTLTGKITQLKRRAGNLRQTTYTFRLTLTDVNTGREAWTKTVRMTKQGTKPAVGF